MALSTKWEVSHSLSNFFTGSQPVWVEKTKSLVTLGDEAVYVQLSNIDGSPDAPYKIYIENDGITSFAACQSGTIILTCSRSTMIRRWHREIVINNTESGSTSEVVWKQKHSWRGPSGFVSSACVDSTDSLLITGSTDGSVRVWDITGGFCTHNFTGHSGPVSRVRIHPRRLLVLSSGDDRTLRGWDLRENKCLFSLNEHVAKITDFDFSQHIAPDGPDHLLSVAGDQTFIMWDLTLGQMIFQVPILKEAFTVIALPRDLAPITSKKLIAKIPEEDRNRYEKLKQRVPYVILTAGADGNLSFWDIALIPKDMRGAKPIKSIATPHAVGGAVANIIRTSHALESTSILTTGIDLSIAHWSIESGCSVSLRREMIGHAADFFTVKLAVDPTQPPYISKKANAQDENDDTLIDVPRDHADVCGFLTSDESLRLLDVASGDSLALRASTTDDSIIISMDISPCGRYAATGAKDGIVRVWSLESFECFSVLSGHAGAVGIVALANKLSSYPPHADITLVTVSTDKTAKIWSVPAPVVNPVHRKSSDRGVVELQRAWADRIAIRSAAANAAANLESTPVSKETRRKGIVTKSDDNNHHNLSRLRTRYVAANQSTIGVDTPELISVKKSEFSIVPSARDTNALVIAPNDKMFATAGQDKVIKLWSLPEGKLKGELKGHTKAVWSLAFSPTDKVLASGAADGNIKLWSLVDNTILRTLQGHESPVSQIAFLPNGLQIISAANDGVMKLWVNKTSTCISSMDTHTDKVWSLSLSGSTLATGGADTRLCIWKDKSTEAELHAMKEKQEEAEKDAQIDQALRAGHFASALRASLALNRPASCREVWEKILQRPLDRIVEEIDAEEKMIESTVNIDVDSMVESDEEMEDDADEDVEEEETTDASSSVSNKEEMINEDDEIIDAVVIQPSTKRARSSSQRVTEANADKKQRESIVKAVLTLNRDHLTRLVAFATDWAANARHAWVATSVLTLIFTLHGPKRLLRSVEGLSALANNAVGYMNRHSLRLAALKQKSFLIDLTLMDSSAANSMWKSRAADETREILMGNERDEDESTGDQNEDIITNKKTRNVVFFDDSEDDEE